MNFLEEAGEKEIINKLSHVNYLKVAHHGSKGASSEAFPFFTHFFK
jgi:competence protein ComEC